MLVKIISVRLIISESSVTGAERRMGEWGWPGPDKPVKLRPEGWRKVEGAWKVE